MIFAWDPRIWHDTSLAVSNVQQMIILRDCFRFILISMKCELSRRPTWFSFQVSRQFLLSLFLAPLCLIITLIMFSDRIITVSLTTSLYVLRWPPLLQVWPLWCLPCPPPHQPLTASWSPATSTPASPTWPATSTSGPRLIGLSEHWNVSKHVYF